MIVIAASLYLPEHVATMLSRAWFYYAGEENAVLAPGQGAVAPAGVGRGGGKMGGPGELWEL